MFACDIPLRRFACDTPAQRGVTSQHQIPRTPARRAAAPTAPRMGCVITALCGVCQHPGCGVCQHPLGADTPERVLTQPIYRCALMTAL
jgi:hypothetical protein